MKATGRWSSVLVSALALAVSVSFVTPIGAQDPSSPASLLAQRGQLAESILAAKERAMGEPFGVSIRAYLKSRMEALSLEQLAGLSQQGAGADIPLVLGSVTSDLVYTPVTPCRVFDTRVSQGGTGPILANTQRNVLVVGTVGFPAQGGFAGGCGIPVGATSAIINFVTVSPAGPGNIRAWAVASPQPPAPLAAILNYGSVAGLPAIANGVAVPLCNPAATSCTLGDLRLQADTSSTDILGDVVGYFGAAVGAAGPPGPTGATGPAGPQGMAGNLGLANQSCPAGQSISGFGPNGNLVCNGVAQFFGVQVNTPISALTGWTQCYLDTYDNAATPVATILAACGQANLLLGCRDTGSPNLTAFAHAPRADVLFDCGPQTICTKQSNGAGWYFSDSYSWGFAPGGQTVNRDSCDINNPADGGRLCWHTFAGMINGGYRCGSNLDLNNSTAFQRIIFQHN